MPTYDVTSRTTSPTTVTSVTADSPEGAIDQTIKAAADGESVEVMQVVETAPDSVAPQSKKEK